MPYAMGIKMIHLLNNPREYGIEVLSLNSHARFYSLSNNQKTD